MANITDNGIQINSLLRSINPTTSGWMSFIDGDGARVLIHTGTVVALYDLMKHRMSHAGMDEDAIKCQMDLNYNEGRP